MRSLPLRDIGLFLILAVGIALLLSLAWIWIGPFYNDVLARSVSPFLPSIVTLGHEGHTINIGTTLAHLDDPPVWHVSSMMMHYGLIVALAVLLAGPGLRLRVRVVMLMAAVVVAFTTHVVSLFLFAGKVEWIMQNQQEAEAILSLGRALHYVWLGAPSLVWLPALLWSWQQRQSRSLGFVETSSTKAAVRKSRQARR